MRPGPPRLAATAPHSAASERCLDALRALALLLPDEPCSLTDAPNPTHHPHRTPPRCHDAPHTPATCCILYAIHAYAYAPNRHSTHVCCAAAPCILTPRPYCCDSSHHT